MAPGSAGSKVQGQTSGGGSRDRHQLVLAGGGHSHVLVLRRWVMRPRSRPANTRISLVNRHGTALYSGLLPAVVAGLEPRGAAAIDLRRLCSLAGVTFVQAEISGLDPAGRELQLAGRPPLRFERLSLDVGAVTAMPGEAVAVKPLEPFLGWADRREAGEELVIRGGGAAAVEVALAFRARGLACRLLLRGEALHLGSAAANRAGERLLAEAGIALQRHAPAELPADLACTGSHAPAWLAAAGLPVEPGSGRVLTHPSLEVIGHPGLFASGDCGLIAADPRPPSGVWAVRAAPVLAENLRRSLDAPRRSLRPWRPQQRALQLLGDGGWHAEGPRALAFLGPLALGPAGWIWRWKQHIDRAFMARFADLRPMAPDGRPGPDGLPGLCRQAGGRPAGGRPGPARSGRPGAPGGRCRPGGHRRRRRSAAAERGRLPGPGGRPLAERPPHHPARLQRSVGLRGDGGERPGPGDGAGSRRGPSGGAAAADPGRGGRSAGAPGGRPDRRPHPGGARRGGPGPGPDGERPGGPGGALAQGAAAGRRRAAAEPAPGQRRAVRRGHGGRRRSRSGSTGCSKRCSSPRRPWWICWGPTASKPAPT